MVPLSSLVAPSLKEVQMGKKLYVGNLPFSATEQVLTDTFSQCGNVESVKIITDRDTGRSKGFGFVEMSSDAEAAAAISKFNGADYEGRSLTVNEAKPMVPREGGGGGGRGGFGGGGGGGGRGGFGGGGGGGRGGRY
jgi:RNA recognition motif-containing protein